MQRAAIVARGEFAVGGAGLGECLGGHEGDDGAELRVEAGDTGEIDVR